MQDVDDFGSVAWDTAPLSAGGPALPAETTAPANDEPVPLADAALELDEAGATDVQVKDAVKELEGTKDMFVSYMVTLKTSLPLFQSTTPSARRRFQDFTFLREHLTKDFPAAVVPPLPDKHRMEYLTGDRFSAEFIERRRVDLQRFLERLARHPKLSRTKLFQAFLESTEWNVFKHQQLAHPADPDPPSGLLDNISDTLLNAFTKVRKPDERFVEMKTLLDQFDEGLTSIERLGGRSKLRLGDLSGDYEDLAASVQGLGYLESGITEPLLRFEHALVEFGHAVRDSTTTTAESFLEHLHSLLAYSTSFRAVLKLRDQKQLDFEELSSYLSNVSSERDRLAGGYGYGMGIGNYFKDKVESLRGGETESGKEAKMARLDAKIKELQDAVIASQDTSKAFNDELLAEYTVFKVAKRVEMKELLGEYADGQIAMYEHQQAEWEKAIPFISKITVE